jgi:hypothetical protein
MAGGIKPQKAPVVQIQHVNDPRAELPRMAENRLLQRGRRHARGAAYGFVVKREKLIWSLFVLLVCLCHLALPC